MAAPIISHSEELDDIITAQPHWFVRLGTGLFLLLLGALLLLSWLVKYPTVVRCRLIMNAVNAPKPVLAKTTSRLTAVLVRDQAPVRKGQVLALLENPADNAQVLRLGTYLDSLARTGTATSRGTRPYQPVHFPARLGELQARYQVFAQAHAQY